MYAVIKTGGKQYKVASGDVVKLEKIAGEEGKEVIFNEVLALDDTVGTPLVSGASHGGQQATRFIVTDGGDGEAAAPGEFADREQGHGHL